MTSSIKQYLTAILITSAAALSAYAEKIKVSSMDELPRISYEAESLPSAIVADPEQVLALATEIEADLEDILSKYEISDQGTVRAYMGTLRTIAMLKGDWENAVKLNKEVREMQEKPAERLTSGLSTDAILNTLIAGHSVGDEAFTDAFKADYTSKIAGLPWDTVQDVIEASKGSMEMISGNYLMGIVQSSMDPGAQESGQIDFGIASALIRFRMMIDYIIPNKVAMVDVLSEYIDNNRIEKEDIWAERSVDLSDEDGLNAVVVAIWDSGVDTEIFAPLNQLWTNEDEIPGDGIDNDQNGWVDDMHGIAHDLKSFKTQGDLFELPEDIAARYDALMSLAKGMMDVRSSIDSDEATEFKQYMASLTPEAVEPFLLDLGYFGNYTHGTHVAGIAAEGNPAIQLMSVRITFDHKIIPDAPQLVNTLRGVKSSQQVAQYLRENNVRVVNMSWGGSQAGFERALEANGIGDDAEMRAEIARVHFDIFYDALVDAMASCPGILFIPAAGNSDENIEFNKVLPSSIALSNVLVAGAVDQAGDETSFTSYGDNVRVHANGFEVDSYLPGGKRQKFSGTSMSAPNVTNLAAKLLAIDPTLSPEEIISLITLGADTSEDGRRNLLNPKKSMALLKLKNGTDF
ncbi:MAG: S8 family serine peptidase [Opitutales bacterium]